MRDRMQGNFDMFHTTSWKLHLIYPISLKQTNHKINKFNPNSPREFSNYLSRLGLQSSPTKIHQFDMLCKFCLYRSEDTYMNGYIRKDEPLAFKTLPLRIILKNPELCWISYNNSISRSTLFFPYWTTTDKFELQTGVRSNGGLVH